MPKNEIRPTRQVSRISRQTTRVIRLQAVVQILGASSPRRCCAQNEIEPSGTAPRRSSGDELQEPTALLGGISANGEPREPAGRIRSLARLEPFFDQLPKGFGAGDFFTMILTHTLTNTALQSPRTTNRGALRTGQRSRADRTCRKGGYACSRETSFST